MNLFPLPLFPQGSLAESVITTVWLGAMVVIFFNTRFGWTLSGIIVPGYLVPLLILKPVSVAVILVEGCVTYFLVRLLFVAPASPGLWGRVFGRDRFFAIILVSIVVRLGFDAWLLPQMAEFLGTHWNLSLDLRVQMQGFGLIILALMANQFWKPGFRRGLISLSVTLAITWALVVFLLIPFTNFTISNVAYLYEDMAGSIDSSPKAYIILVIAAYLASRMNLNYGWEYNGIMVPALLGLLWHQPEQIIMTVLEALAIFLLAKATLQLPFLQNSTIEGGRKLLFFFTIGFFYKVLLGHGLAWFAPTVRVTGFFGFGYMLSTLMAMKMHQKRIPIQLTRATLQVSLVAAVLANGLGYVLTLFPKPSSDTPKIVERRDDLSEKSPLARLRDLKPELYGVSETFSADNQPLRDLLQKLWIAPDMPDAEALEAAGYQAVRLEDRYLFLNPSNPASGAIYVFDTRAAHNLAMTVPYPVQEQLTMEAGLHLAANLKARLVIFGDTVVPPGASSLTVRSGKTDELHINGDLPMGLDLSLIDRAGADLPTLWQAVPTRFDADAVIFLNKTTRRRLLLAAQAADRRNENARLIERRGLPFVKLAAAADGIIRADADREYRPPSRSQLLFFESEVLSPLLRLMTNPDVEAIKPELALLAGTAAVLRYRIYLYRQDGEAHVVLAERSGDKARGLGTYVFRVGATAPFQVQIPRPVTESGTAAFGIALYDSLKARSLLMTGAQPKANPGKTGDPLTNRASMFNLVYQADMRACRDQKLTAVQVRATRSKDPVQAEAVLSSTGELPADMHTLTNFLAGSGISVAHADGSAEVAAYQALRLPQARYLDQTGDKGLIALWLGPETRERYRVRDENSHQIDRYAALSIPTKNRNITSWLSGQLPGLLEPEMLESLNFYLETRNVTALHRLIQNGNHLTRVRDSATRQSYLVVADHRKRPALIANLETRSGGEPRTAFNAVSLRQILNERTALCVWGEP
ncbi:MAG: poly-gamma-glutamate biosynthesis protein PgsC/CapC [Acidobacteriota bacterium]|nr:poly-gamma-glutamate biosynthesis protein PgsC/CapC [Acidobacteriota bacterium]